MLSNFPNINMQLKNNVSKVKSIQIYLKIFININFPHRIILVKIKKNYPNMFILIPINRRVSLTLKITQSRDKKAFTLDKS